MSENEEMSNTYIEPGAITSDRTFADRAVRLMRDTGCSTEEAVGQLMRENL